MSETPKAESPPQPQAPAASGNVEAATDQSALVKRPLSDDEIEFISSNPVKKRRMTEQKPNQMPQGSMPPPPPPIPREHTPVVKQQTPTAEQIPPLNRSQSLCGPGLVKGPVADAMLKTRGTSLPVLDNFAFPTSFPPVPAQSSRLSVAISPKQLPQALTATPEVDDNPSQPASGPAAQNSVALDQISCLDFNGIPVNTPGFDLGRIFSADNGIMSALGLDNTGIPAPAPPPVNPLTTQNTIPFTMYSTGNIVTMPQTGANQSLAAFPSQPMQHQHHQHQPQQPGVFAPRDTLGSQVQYPANHHHQASLPREQPSSSRSPTPTPGAKPACLHCARLRQENLMRRAQAPPLLPGTAVQPHNQAAQPHMCAPSSNHLPPPTPAPSPLRPTPRSTPAGGQLANVHQRQQQQHLPATHPPATLMPSAPAPQIPLSAMLSVPARPGPAPSLLQDIAQTVQASFPYAQLAARHGVAPARVAEVVSRMVIGPLLRGGADRGSGSGGYQGS
jgi:hypothetical protein